MIQECAPVNFQTRSTRGLRSIDGGRGCNPRSEFTRTTKSPRFCCTANRESRSLRCGRFVDQATRLSRASRIARLTISDGSATKRTAKPRTQRFNKIIIHVSGYSCKGLFCRLLHDDPVLLCARLCYCNQPIRANAGGPKRAATKDFQAF